VIAVINQIVRLARFDGACFKTGSSVIDRRTRGVLGALLHLRVLVTHERKIPFAATILGLLGDAER